MVSKNLSCPKRLNIETTLDWIAKVFSGPSFNEKSILQSATLALKIYLPHIGLDLTAGFWQMLL